MSINIIIDIVLVALSVLIILKFTVRGFWRSVLDTLKVPVAFIIAYLTRIPVAKLFDSWFMRDGITKWVRDSLFDSVEGNDTFINFIELYKSAPKVFTSFLSKFGLGDVSDLKTMENASEARMEEIAIELGTSISMFLSTVLAVLALFIVALILLIVIVKVTDGIMMFGAIKVINRILGFVLGVAVAALFIWGVSFLLDLLVDLTHDFGGHLSESDLEDSMAMGMVKEIFNNLAF